MADILNINKELKSKYSKLKFNENKHQYTIGERSFTPVTNVAKSFSEQFDVEFHSKRIAKRDGITQDEVKRRWKEIGEKAANFGSDVHDFGERYVQSVYFSNGNCPLPRNNKEKVLISYWEDTPTHLYPVATELRMYSEKYGFAGTCDVLLFDSLTGNFIILDYKTNSKNLFNSYGEVMLPPFHFLPNNSYNIYQLQLSLYQMMLEDAGYKVQDRIILWLKDNEYEAFNTYDFTKQLRAEL